MLQHKELRLRNQRTEALRPGAEEYCPFLMGIWFFVGSPVVRSVVASW